MIEMSKEEECLNVPVAVSSPLISQQPRLLPSSSLLRQYRNRGRRRSRSRDRRRLDRPRNVHLQFVEPVTISMQCQLAHGSPTGLIKQFSSLSHLYKDIADCFDEINVDQILFCTVNTHRLDMNCLVSGSIRPNDFIFAHVAGQRKEVQLKKTTNLLGLVITDNGAGKVFIKAIKPNTDAAMAQPALAVGDFIEKVDDQSVAGKRHVQVSAIMAAIRPGNTFTLRLVEPIKSGFAAISNRGQSNKKKTGTIGDGTKTIRFKTNGTAVLQEAPNPLIVSRINDVFDAYLGFHDDDLALQIWELGRDCDTLLEMGNNIKQSPVNTFDFPDELIFDIWGLVDDWKYDRLQTRQQQD